MDAMNSPTNLNTKNSFKSLLHQIKLDYSDVTFTSSKSFYWSADSRTVFFDEHSKDAIWSLLHELGHMTHGHSTYNSDIRLLRMEVEAWDKAREIAQTYNVVIDEDHIQDCIDSYRSWLHERSICPRCSQVGAEKSGGDYNCINCGSSWHVTENRFCRVYRSRTK